MGVLKAWDGTDWREVGCPGTTVGYMGADQSYVVPAGVTVLRCDMFAGEGADGTFHSATPGGLGGHLMADLTVTPGETLMLRTGQMAPGASGGWPDGGDGFFSANGSVGGGGGGSTSVWRGATLLAIVGGGGGSGGGESTEDFGAGGDGGGTVGANGEVGNTAGTSPGGGGTSSAGGAAGSNGTYVPGSGSPQVAATAGGYLSGGDGGQYSGWYNGGGGGGGYYGGGGGGSGAAGSVSGPNAGSPDFYPATCASGGGGGSSWTSGTVLVDDQGIHAGSGGLTLTPLTPGRLRLLGSDGHWYRETCPGETGHPLKIEDPGSPGTWVTVGCFQAVGDTFGSGLFDTAVYG